MAFKDTDFVFYNYNPSLVAAIIFILLFSSLTVFHAFQLIRKGTWYFIPFLIGCIFESIGYIGRAVSSKQSPNWTLGSYICQSLLILLAPALFAASIYMILGRIILLTDGETHSVIRARWLTKVFVAGDVLSFLAQSAGGGILATAKSQSTFNLGQNVITAGLGIQVFFFSFFILTAAIFHYRIVQAPTARARSLDVPWQRYLSILYLASGLIMVRSVFRIVEYVQGGHGYLLSHEVFLYLFDATLMLVLVGVFAVWHPSAVVQREKVAYAGDAVEGGRGDGGYELTD